jgi:hypothetical protein
VIQLLASEPESYTKNIKIKTMRGEKTVQKIFRKKYLVTVWNSGILLTTAGRK